MAEAPAQRTIARPLTDAELDLMEDAVTAGPRTTRRWQQVSTGWVLAALMVDALVYFGFGYLDGHLTGPFRFFAQPAIGWGAVATFSFLVALGIAESHRGIHERASRLGQSFAAAVRDSRAEPRVAVMVRTSPWWRW